MKITRGKDTPESDRGGYLVKKILSENILPKEEHSFDGIMGFLTTVLKGGECKEQHHNYSYEAIFFLDSGIGVINGETYYFEFGDSLFLEPGDKHSFQATNSDLRMYAIRVPNLPEDKVSTEK